MEVFLVPVGDRYVPYCEIPDTTASEPDAASSPGFLRGFVARFRHVLASIERRANEKTEGTPDTVGRIRERAYHWLARWMASQRLLWGLRHLDAAILVYPSDLPASRAHALLAGYLDGERRRHALWALVYSLLGLVSIPVAVVPGPNFVGYLFVFLLVGHFFSYRGAGVGRTRVTWRDRSDDALVELRRLASIDAAHRDEFLRAMASRLGLSHLGAFFERVTAEGA